MQLLISPAGELRTVYDELLPLSAFGRLSIRRASAVEPDAHGHWWVDLAPVDGPQLGPFPQRSLALEAEHEWLQQHWLFADPTEF